MHPGLPRLRCSFNRRLEVTARVCRFSHKDRALAAFEHAQVRKAARTRRSTGQVHRSAAVRTQREDCGVLAAKVRKLCRQHHHMAPFYQTTG
jgi:hypothetical protein